MNEIEAMNVYFVKQLCAHKNEDEKNVRHYLSSIARERTCVEMRNFMVQNLHPTASKSWNAKSRTSFTSNGV